MDTNMQLTINSFKPLFPDNIEHYSLDTSLTFSNIRDISLTAVKFPDISRFSSEVVTLMVLWGNSGLSENFIFLRIRPWYQQENLQCEAQPVYPPQNENTVNK